MVKNEDFDYDGGRGEVGGVLVRYYLEFFFFFLKKIILSGSDLVGGRSPTYTKYKVFSWKVGGGGASLRFIFFSFFRCRFR